MVSFPLLVTYILVGLVSLLFIGTWLIKDRSMSWTFLVSLFAYVPMMFALYAQDWRVFGVIAFVFVGVVHLYFYDQYFSYFHATKRGRR